MKKETTMLNNGSISQEQYDKQLHSKITETQLNSLSKHDLQVLAIYREMSAGSHLIANDKNEDVSEKEYAAVSQQLDNLPGVNTSMDWDENIHMVKL